MREHLQPPDRARAIAGGSALQLTAPPRLLGHLRKARRTLRLPWRRLARALPWLASFTAISTVLIVRNAYLFTTKIYEDSDFAADSIAVLQAKHFELLTGNYSRLGFYHPGPAFLYVEAWGEWLFHDVAHLVPTPWNGQLLAILLLNAALLATVVCVFARDGGPVAAIACLCTVLAFTVLHPLTVNSNWMPYVYFAPTLLLLVSAAAVAAGRTTSVPLLCLAAGLCINGNAEFLFFAPIVVIAALATLVAPHWRDPRVLIRVSPRHWLAAVAITFVLALPIVLNTILNWPGELPEYFDYGIRAGNSLHHTPGMAVSYTLRFWWPGGPVRGAQGPEQVIAAVGGIVIFLLVLWLARTCRDAGQRRFLLRALVMVALMTVLFLYYAWHGIDELFTAYEGYFYWSVPLLLLLVAAAALTARIQPAADPRLLVSVLAALTVGAAAAASVVPLHPDDPYGPGQYFGDPAVPHTVAVLNAASGGREIVLQVPLTGWGDAVGVIVYADRIGVRACVEGENWAILFRSQSICTPAEIRDGTAFVFRSFQDPLPGRPLAVLLSSEVFRAG